MLYEVKFKAFNVNCFKIVNFSLLEGIRAKVTIMPFTSGLTTNFITLASWCQKGEKIRGKRVGNEHWRNKIRDVIVSGPIERLLCRWI